ncbi:MAG: IS200/IS605 family transposase [Planctomycetes bacterium]|nr:IS200/IS605 family transposase [Planctomycetota bacterium]
MPQSLARVLVHLVFSTKHRVPVLAPEIRAELHPYIAAVLNNDGCTALRVGGFDDHVHLLFALSRTRTISQVVENVKTSSSKWLKTKSAALSEFHWQKGYGIFSVSEEHADEVVDYILRQEEHHAAQSFQDEVRTLYGRGKLAFDERFMWE